VRGYGFEEVHYWVAVEMVDLEAGHQRVADALMDDLDSSFQLHHDPEEAQTDHHVVAPARLASSQVSLLDLYVAVHHLHHRFLCLFRGDVCGDACDVSLASEQNRQADPQ